jgi:biotin carboxyl carrier protein
VSDETTGPTPASADGPGIELEALTDEVLPALIARLRASRLGELEVRSGSWRIRLRRQFDAGSRAAVTGGPPAADDRSDVLGGSIVRSSAVGYFTPSPDLVVGHSVQAGDLLGSIDVLGIVGEVTAPQEGIISAVLAEDGQAVEYGQGLAEIDPLEPDAPTDRDEGEVA